MSNLKYYQNKIKQKRKNTPFREFLKKVSVWRPYKLNKINSKISLYSLNSRTPILVDNEEFLNYRSNPKFIDYDFSLDFFQNFKNLMKICPVPYTLSYYNDNENCEYSDNSF